MSSSSTAPSNEANKSSHADSPPAAASTTSTIPTAAAASDNSSTSSQLYQMLCNIAKQPHLQPQHVLVIGNLAFGNDQAKQIVAGLEGLLEQKLILEYYCASEYCNSGNTNSNSLQFLKTLRACVVNCAAARAKCRHATLYQKMVQELQQASQHKRSSYLPLVQDYVTTLCALCINDDDNTRLLKQTLEKGDCKLRRDFFVEDDDVSTTNESENDDDDIRAKIRQDIDQRMSFLEALMEAL